jgi:hypothetical protein
LYLVFVAFTSSASRSICAMLAPFTYFNLDVCVSATVASVRQ